MALDDPDLPMQGLVPTDEELKEFMALTVRHARPDLEYKLLLPNGWYQQPAPPSRYDFSKEGEFAPLGLFTPTENFLPPIVYSVGVRPAPKTGAVTEWLERQCYLNKLALERMKINRFLFGLAADAVALEASDLGPMKMRVTMFEDGGRLFILTGMAPIKLWEAAVPTLSLATLTFELLQPKGQTAPVPVKLPPEEGGPGGDKPG
jgi:hypothetical protein